MTIRLGGLVLFAAVSLACSPDGLPREAETAMRQAIDKDCATGKMECRDIEMTLSRQQEVNQADTLNGIVDKRCAVFNRVARLTEGRVQSWGEKEVNVTAVEKPEGVWTAQMSFNVCDTVNMR